MKKIAGALLCAAMMFSAVGIVGSIGSSYQTNRVAIASAEGVSAEKYKEVAAKKSAVNLQIQAKASYLMDFATETVMFAQNERAHLPIASMCKIMTLILSFDAIKAGNMDINEELTVSERAASMGGSQVFLEANAKYPVKELIKSVVVCSANDSCVALAERIAGSEEIFTERMNEKAR